MQLQLFSPETARGLRWQIFSKTDLGRLYQALPLAALAALLPKSANPQGRKPWLTNFGKVAVLFLKSYLGLSDDKLRQRLNTDWALQYFCGIQLEPHQEIRDKDLVGRARGYVAVHLNMEAAQEVLLEHWRCWIDQPHMGLMDATVYESHIKYPTQVKLLWDCCEWLHHQIKYISKELCIKRPRSKIKEHRSKQLAYHKKKRKTHKEKRRRLRGLLYLCNKLIGQLAEMMLLYEAEIEQELELDVYFWDRLKVVHRIYAQQQAKYDHPQEKQKDLIVSLFKPYLRAIVRGKENKRVEFGAKVHMLQVDGINFIEHLTFNAFHEGKRLKPTVWMHRRYFGRLRQLGGDDIYATNENRSYCSQQHIATCFKPKGKSKHDPTLRQQDQKVRHLIGKARATILEGSFGNEKNHYTLRKIPARTQPTEIAWIFFGIMTANAIKIGKRMANAPPQARRA